MTPAEVETGLRLLARLAARAWTRCDRCARPATHEAPIVAFDRPRLFRCDAHAEAGDLPVAWGAEDMRALTALAYPAEPGALSQAEIAELRRQGA